MNVKTDKSGPLEYNTFLTISGSASNVKFEGKRRENGTKNGEVAWKGLTEEHDSHTKRATRACHEKLANTKMKPDQDPDGLCFVLDECNQILEGMKQTVHDERHDSIII